MAQEKDFNDDDLKGLSDEEKEAIAEDGGLDPDNPDPDTDPAPAPADPEDPPVEDPPPAEDPPADPPPVEDPPADPKPVDPEPKPVEDPPPAAPPVDPEAELQAKFDTLKTEKDELSTKLQDGEIDFSEYQTGMDAITEKTMDLKLDVQKDSIKAELSQEHEDKLWRDATTCYFAKEGRQEALKSPIVAAAFRQAVETAAKESFDDYDDLLSKAEAMVEASGIKMGATPADPPPDPDKKTGKRKAATTVQLPDTLGAVPAADLNVGKNPFDHIDKLEGMAMELAIAKMSPEQQAAYEAEL